MLQDARILCLAVLACAAVSARGYDTTERSEAMFYLNVPLGASGPSAREPTVGLGFSARDDERRRHVNMHWFEFDAAVPEHDSGFRLDLDFGR